MTSVCSPARESTNQLAVPPDVDSLRTFGRRIDEVHDRDPHTGKGWYLDQIVEALRNDDIEFSLERDARFSQLGKIVGWLQRCAHWSIDAWSERRGKFRDLADDLREYLIDGEHPAGRTALAAAEFLFPWLERPVDPDTPLDEWLSAFVDALGLDDILERGGIHAQDQEALADLLDVVLTREGLVVQDFAGPIRRPGRIVVTTYHSSKGRQCDAVILPRAAGRRHAKRVEAAGQAVAVQRHRGPAQALYVGITRPRHTLALLWSPLGENRYGDPGRWPRSRFLDAVLEQL